MEGSSWESHARFQIGSFRLWRRSASCPSLGVSFPSVEHLYIQSRSYLHHEFQAAWEYHSENSQWLELLRPFTAVKALYISREFVSKIVPVLQELVRKRVTEVLPALQTLLFEEPLSSGPDQEVIEQFISARRLSGRPMAVSLWEDEDKPEWVCEDDED